MHPARSGSTSQLPPWNRALGIAALLLPSLACSLSGAGLGDARDSVGDPETDFAAGQRRDAGWEARGPSQADATTADVTSPDATSPDATSPDAMAALADAVVGVADAMTGAPRDASVPPLEAAVDGGEGLDAAHDAAPPDPGPTCSLIGSFAARLDFKVRWAPTLVPLLEGGKGMLSMIATVRIAAGGATVIEPCGANVPDFKSTPSVGGELYGGDIADDAWDAPSMPSFGTETSFDCAHPGCGYAAAKTTMTIGARSVGGSGGWPAPGGWSASGEFNASDDDDDGLPGLTLAIRGPSQTSVDGRPYAYPPLGVPQYGRAHKLLLALSVRFQLEGHLASCERIEGTSEDSDVRVSAVGCAAAPDGETQEIACSPELAQLVDANFPSWSVQSTRFQMRRLAPDAGCEATRAALMQSQSGSD